MEQKQQHKTKRRILSCLSFVEKNFLIFFSYAVLGYIYEFFLFLARGQLVNRGFLTGPYLPVYGCGGLLLYYILYNFRKKKQKKNILFDVISTFLIIFVVTTIVEYIAHYILDTYFGIVLWDYTKDYLNINGRVCFAASRNFAIGGTFCMYFVQPYLDKIIEKYDGRDVYHFILYALFSIMLLDFLMKVI